MLERNRVLTAQNIVLLTIDCFRFDRVNANGYSARTTTPNLDKLLSREAVNFTQTISSGCNTQAAFPSLFASSHNVMYGGSSYLSDERTTVAELLSEMGYKTIGLSSNPYISPEFGYDRGFNIFCDSAQRSHSFSKKKQLLSKIVPRDSTLWNMLRRVARRREVHQNKKLYPSASEMNRRLLDTIPSGTSKHPFFAWLHYMDLHYPYNIGDLDLQLLLDKPVDRAEISDTLSKLMSSPESVTEKEKLIVSSIYDASLRYIDAQIDELICSMQENGLWDDIVLIVTADHGEELFELGEFGHGRNGEKVLFADTLIHIPLILKVPGITTSPKKIECLVSQIDIPATILDLAGGSQPDNWYGKSVMPLVKGESTVLRKEAITQQGVQHSFAISWRTEKWKLQFNAFNGEKRLFQIPSDMEAEKDVTDEFPEMMDELFFRVEKHLEEHKDAYSQERLRGLELDDDLRKQLEGLGYV